MAQPSPEAVCGVNEAEFWSENVARNLLFEQHFHLTPVWSAMNNEKNVLFFINHKSIYLYVEAIMMVGVQNEWAKTTENNDLKVNKSLRRVERNQRITQEFKEINILTVVKNKNMNCSHFNSDSKIMCIWTMGR